jgi:hypothetical protein
LIKGSQACVDISRKYLSPFISNLACHEGPRASGIVSQKIKTTSSEAVEFSLLLRYEVKKGKVKYPELLTKREKMKIYFPRKVFV